MLSLLKPPKFVDDILEKLKSKEESRFAAETDAKRMAGLGLTYGDINQYVEQKAISEYNHGFRDGLCFAIDILEPERNQPKEEEVSNAVS